MQHPDENQGGPEAGSKADRANQERVAREAYVVNREDDRPFAVAPHEKLVAGGSSESHNALKGQHLDEVQDSTPPDSPIEAYSDAMRDGAFNHRDTDALDLTSSLAAAEAPATAPEVADSSPAASLDGAISAAIAGIAGIGIMKSERVENIKPSSETPVISPEARIERANREVLPRDPNILNANQTKPAPKG